MSTNLMMSSILG